ncbi:MAG: branched-chain amino acid ABC transporter permease [Deltaproteobacteria bacterium]|nr:branched-chain amino acid ABC transporter permease [Deltaproteobacteria bacterium]MBW1924419.1 branched-chain amino acid ABC transporter permease [Deltaproteobacteria bacterium]MBW1948257.1 branched-chain amino acid ABC transporter permease [Deltaproteobacteria bacterium]MBW2007833.1 branched-chain amino acid ABC transporter permease [Deltaproteobacteria bacterium]MBW2101739.1 branched-chain amino acid ABC transporter permease [Deltaproteobacteria bacterium]
MPLPSGIYNVTYKEDMAILRTWCHWVWLIAFLAFLALIPAFATRSQLNTLITIACSVIAVHGLNLLTGYCGQISMGHSAFVAVGAYTSAIFCNNLGFSFWIAMPLAGLSAGLAGLVFGGPSLRVKGFYLAITTLGAQFIILFVIIHLPSLTGGVRSLDVPPPSLFGYLIETDYSYYYLAMPMAVITTYLVKNISRTGVGRAFVAIRDNDLAAEGMGIALFYNKMLAFFLGCFFAGISGSVYAHYLQTINIEYFTLMDSIWYLAMLIVGGLGQTMGPIFGVIFMVVLRNLIMETAPLISRAVPVLGIEFGAAMSLVVLGLVIMFFLVFEPRGLAHRWEIIKTKFRLYPFPY